MDIPVNLRQACPALPDPTEGTGVALMRWAREVIRLYNDCADRHDRTIEALQ